MCCALEKILGAILDEIIGNEDNLPSKINLKLHKIIVNTMKVIKLVKLGGFYALEAFL